MGSLHLIITCLNIGTPKNHTNLATCGHNHKLEKPRCKTSLRLQHFSRRIIKEWNALPSSVVNAKDVNDFKSKLDSHWNHEVMYEY